MAIRFVCPRCWTVRDDLDESVLGKLIKCNECHAMSVATHTPDPLALPLPAKSKPTPSQAATEEVVQGQSVPAVILSTGDIRIQYEIIDLVFAQATSNEFGQEGVPFEEVFKTVKSRLAQEALKLGANGVAHIHFDFRTAKTVLELPRSFEIYACGTAVKIEARDEG